MNTKEPELQDFGITPEEYDIYNEKRGDISARTFASAYAICFVVVVSVVFVAERDWGVAIWWGIIAAMPLNIITGLAIWAALVLGQLLIVRYKRFRLLRGPATSQIKLYEEAWVAWRLSQQEVERAKRETKRAQQEAERTRQRKLEEYWTSLSGIEFEEELGALYRRLGYRVESTPRTGDQGIDLILNKSGKRTIVQCKRYKDPAGPAVARELYGSLKASSAHNAVLACTAGFTQGVREFVRGKPIALISASDLVKMGESIQDKTQVGTSNPPICPMQGCGKAMATRTGRYGIFWGCPAFPKCKGTREFRAQ